ncbi:hypothetical protein C1H46_041924 [Malus baccata]|uniref:alpha-1,2-Mannosidase n=1 Tax=Malus baccata TaxID=106549 RepID=A0A540KE92_MALBA|nr:hypothetical protein C1H46_041924 [Malus baccata]
MGNNTEFESANKNLKFNVNARVNLFECNIRVLGGIVSAHLLATDSTNRLGQGVYKNQLLTLAEDLGKRFLPAFNTPTGLPYAWINIQSQDNSYVVDGVMEKETTETSTSGCGEGLSFAGMTIYYFKGHILVGNEEFWRMFHSAVQKYFRHGPWFLLAILQPQCIEKVWSNTREVFVGPSTLHPTEKYYPLRPELAESTFDLYQATKCPWYIEVGESILNSLNLYTKMERGFANIRDVTTMQLEDHQHSFFLDETAVYHYLLIHIGRDVLICADRKASAMCVQVCPPTTMNSWECGGEQVESACHGRAKKTNALDGFISMIKSSKRVKWPPKYELRRLAAAFHPLPVCVQVMAFVFVVYFLLVQTNIHLLDCVTEKKC